jgi:Ca2+-binding RTX toxin-like protein
VIIPLPTGDKLISPPSDASGAALHIVSSGILYTPTAGQSQLDYGQSTADKVTYVDGTGSHTVSLLVEGFDHGPLISGLVANASTGSGTTTDVTITGAATGLDDLGSIQIDSGPATSFTVAGGTFSFAESLSAGDHVATLTLQDQSSAPGSVSGVTTRQIDINIGGGDASTMTSSTGGPAILVGSTNPAVSQTIVGTHYADTLIAGAGNDTMTGKGGGDTFVFKPNMGNDVITDFHANSGSGPADVVDLTAFHFASYQALLSNVTDTPAGDVITLGTHTVTLDGVHTAQLHASLFHL